MNWTNCSNSIRQSAMTKKNCSNRNSLNVMTRIGSKMKKSRSGVTKMKKWNCWTPC